MLNPWQWGDSDDETVADFLAATVQGVIENGGWIHPGARLISREGELHIECDADEGEPLVRIPVSAMLPITRVVWDTNPEELTVSEIECWPTSADLSLLLTQVGLHNACGKLPRLVTTHPSAVSDLDAEVIAEVRALRPSFRIRTMSPTEVFWATRSFRLPAFAESTEPVAVPIVDMLDHHPNGAVAQWSDGSVTIPISHPTGTSDCHLDYGVHRDALDMAIVYGFADETANLAHSSPVSIEVGGNGGLRVLDRGRRPDGALLPVTAVQVGEIWELSRFTFGLDDGIDAMRQVTNQPGRWCSDAVSNLAAANIILLDDLVEALSLTLNIPAAQVLRTAAGYLRRIMLPYVGES